MSSSAGRGDRFCAAGLVRPARGAPGCGPGARESVHPSASQLVVMLTSLMRIGAIMRSRDPAHHGPSLPWPSHTACGWGRCPAPNSSARPSVLYTITTPRADHCVLPVLSAPSSTTPTTTAQQQEEEELPGRHPRHRRRLRDIWLMAGGLTRGCQPLRRGCGTRWRSRPRPVIRTVKACAPSGTVVGFLNEVA